MRKSTTAAFAVGATVIVAAAVAAAAPAGQAATKPAVSAGSTTPAIIVKPGAQHLPRTFAAPPTTAECESSFHVACYSPQQLRTAYNLSAVYAKGIQGQGQTIVIVDSFGSPTIASDLAVFDKSFGLPAPPSLKEVAPIQPMPKWNWANTDMDGWAGEATLDVEAAHSMAPAANIVLVATPVSETEGTVGFPQIVRAENDVLDNPAKYGITGRIDVISQSFSATEQTFTGLKQVQTLRGSYENAAHKGVTVLTASGDSGAADTETDGETYYTHPVTSWPDSDPLITALGGTQVIDNGGRFSSTTWNDTYNKTVQNYIYGVNGPIPLAGGGGVSKLFTRPTWQAHVDTGYPKMRLVPDISMSAACNGLIDVYESFGKGSPYATGWAPSCGTSEATPLFSGIVALSAQAAGHSLGLIDAKLYHMSAAGAPGIVDVTTGNNTVTFTQGGVTTKINGFNATKGYDMATGVGTVNAAYFVWELANKAVPK